MLRGALPEGAGPGIVAAHHEIAVGDDLLGEGIEGGGEGRSSPWKSRRSGSRLVTTREGGAKARKEPSDSSASITAAAATIGRLRLPPPARPRGGVRAEAGVAAEIRDGRAERPGRIEARTAQRHHGHPGGGGLAVGAGDGEAVRARQAGRPGPLRGGRPGSPRSRAAITSGLSARTAVETTTTSTSSASSVASKPMPMRAPASRSGAMNWPSWESEPLTARPGLEREAGDSGHPGAADADHVHRAHRTARRPAGLGDDVPGAQDRARRGLVRGAVRGGG